MYLPPRPSTFVRRLHSPLIAVLHHWQMFQVFWSIGSICIAGSKGHPPRCTPHLYTSHAPPSSDTVTTPPVAWVILPSLGWRWLMALALAPVAVSLALSFTMPESAAWLATQDRVDEAVATLVRPISLHLRVLSSNQMAHAVAAAAAAAFTSTLPPNAMGVHCLRSHSIMCTSRTTAHCAHCCHQACVAPPCLCGPHGLCLE